MKPTIRIHPADDVVIARRQLVGGTLLEDEGVTVIGLIPPGHKVAVRAIAAGAPVWVILTTSFCVNLRFVVFSAHLRGYVMHLPRSVRQLAGYAR